MVRLSPTENHRYLMSLITPTLQFDGGDVKTWQTRLRRTLRALVGDLPAQRCDLRPRRLWMREHPLGTIEKVVFAAEAYADVPAYVCLPRDVPPPYRFFICLQGHNTGMHHSIAVQREDETEPLDVEGDRDFGLGCMRRGMAALCIEQRSCGERREQKQQQTSWYQPCHDATMQALMLGRTLVSERVYDVDRGIDYLASRGDADMSSLGVMGNSAGGMISMYAAALLPRIALAMPSCSFCTFKDSIMSTYHCMDNYVPGLLKVAEMSDIMGLFAPKPVVIVAGQHDEWFPIHATRRAFRDLRRIYEACGAKGRCHLIVGAGGHRFYADDAWPVMLQELEQWRSSGAGSHARRHRLRRSYRFRR